MAERRHVPLRVRFRSPSEQTRWEHKYGQHPHRDSQSLPSFGISQSYFISHEHPEVFEGMVTVVDKAVEDYEPGGWRPKDALFVPLLSPRKKKLLGFLSLDDPEDGKIPSQESIEVVELFANQ